MDKKQMKKRIWNHSKTLFLYLMLFNSLFIVILGYLATYATTLALKVSRYSYITLENIWPFLTSVKTLLLLVIVLFILAFFYLIGFLGITIYYQTRDLENHMQVSSLLFPALREAKRILGTKKNILLPGFCIMSSMVLSLPLFIGMIFRQRIPAYIFDSINKKIFVIPCAVIILLILVYIVYKGIFSTFYMISDRVTFRESYRLSTKTVKLHRKTILIRLIKNNLLLYLIYVLLYAILIVLTGIATFFLVDDTLASATFLTLYDQINRYYAVVISILGVVVNIKIVYQMFLQFKITDNCYVEEIQTYQRTIEQTKRYRKYVIYISILSFLFVVMSLGFEFRDSFFRQKTPLIGTYITAHRGYSSKAPENTLPAIQSAIDAMSDYVEIDVQETKDGVVVLLHDTNLKRTTGINKDIWNVTYDTLTAYDASKKFAGDFVEVKIPTLREALVLCQNQIFMNIEIKINNHEDQLVEKVVQLIEEYDMEDQCIISSTNYGALSRVKQANENIKTGYIMSLAYGYFYNNEYADFFSVKSSFITKEMVKRAHSLGKEIHAWTVNDIAELERMKQLGVDNIITDRPIRVREVLYEDNLTTSFLEYLKTLIN